MEVALQDKGLADEKHKGEQQPKPHHAVHPPE
jgi:hypothetical protein